MYSKLFLSLFVLLSLSNYVNSLSCSAAWECSSVTDNFNFVDCIDNVCICKTELGFSGSATTSDKCRCDPGDVYWGKGTPYCKICESPASIIYSDGIPYCVSAPDCESLSAEEARQAVHRGVVRQIYENLVYPTPLLILGGSYPINNLFSENSRGRVTPVGSFDDFLSVEEYFYALAATPNSIVTRVFIKSLVSTGNVVGVEVDILFNNTEGQRNLTQMGFYTFDETDRVSSTDLVILNLGAASDPPAAAQPFAIQGLCGFLLQTCSNPEYDPTGYYTDVNDCINFMSGIEYGSWDRANSNSVTCRQLHSLLTITRPEVHCKHSGKTGGGKCIDWTYQSFYDVEY